ncbi:hypothetical protein [Paenibacillus tyrfis]|nr:hypothetical protein [Paenibacillus tyrfis]
MFDLQILRGNPFYLTDEDMDWVKSTLETMTLEEKRSGIYFASTA